jgi:hypothetical protein
MRLYRRRAARGVACGFPASSTDCIRRSQLGARHNGRLR